MAVDLQQIQRLYRRFEMLQKKLKFYSKLYLRVYRRTFGILEGKWKIIMRQIDIPLQI